MRQIAKVLALIAGLSPAIAAAQQILPKNTVWGRLGITASGPAQAIPFATLFAAQGGVAGPQSCASHNWFNTLSSAGTFGCSQPAIGDITGLGAGVPAALALSAGGLGSFVLNSGWTTNLPLVGNGSGGFGQGTRSGNTTIFGTTSGTFTPGDCLKADASGNIIDNGATCGAGANTAATQNFVAGVGFTPGTTTSLTLSSSPTNANELLVAFDGVVQSHNTWSLAGAVITFSVAIPQNVNVIETQWTTASTTAGVGSLTDSASNVAAGAVTLAAPWAVTAGNTIGPGGACFVKSRTAAILLNLSSCNVVMTGGYATPGDGGGATFQNVGSAPFIDSFISAGFINQAGTGCTNGTYTGVYLAGGTGNGGAIATIVVSGGGVTGVSLNVSPGSGYTVGDQLTQNGAFTCSGNAFNWQVTAVTSPGGSFTDSAGNHWQYTPNGGYIYATQFGVKADWTPGGGDAGATNNTTPIQNAMNYAGAGSPQLQAAGGYIGQQVILPKGGVMTCAINVPAGVWLRGVERYATLLKACDVLPTTSHFVTLCDPNTLSSCIAARFSDLTMFPGMGTPVAGTSFIFTNNDQEEGDELQHLSIQSGLRECIHLSVGYGGAAIFGMHEIECGPSELSTNVGIFIEYASALVPMHNILVSTGPTGPFQYGIDYIDGYVDINMYNAENVTYGVYLNNTTSNGTMRIHNETCGARCVYAVWRNTGTLANASVAGFITGGSSGTLNNAGTLTTGQIILDKQF